MASKRLLAIGTLLGAAIGLAGCGGAPGETGPPRMALTGKVTLDGQPVSSGTISFLPPSEMTALRVSGGQIIDGAYSVPKEKGANAGTYRVEIRALKPSGKKMKDPDMGGEIDVMVESIPAKYNEKSELTAEVAPDKTTFDFDLRSK